MLQKAQITEHQLKKAQAQVMHVDSSVCSSSQRSLKHIFETKSFIPRYGQPKFLLIGREDGSRAGEQSGSEPCDCTCRHGCFLRSCGDEGLS